MSCERAQEQVSLWIDAELEESAQAALFGHLEGCSECRRFLDSMVRFRKAAAVDREEIFLSAGEALPPRSPVPAEARRTDAGGKPTRRSQEAGQPGPRWPRVLAGGWRRLPAPVAAGLAVILLAAGALLGARLAAVSGGGGPEWSAARMEKPAVIVVCGLPEVEVVGSGPGGDPQ